MQTLNLVIEFAGSSANVDELRNYYNQLIAENKELFNSHLYNQGNKSALKVSEVKPWISFDSPSLNGFEILNKYFDALFTNNP